jgi:hypothetical protein
MYPAPKAQKSQIDRIYRKNSMAEHEAIKLFESLRIRVVWDDVQEKYYFSIVDVVQVLTESVDGRKYWNKLKQRLIEEGNQTVTNCHQLKLTAADGKQRLTDVADTEQLLRVIQSIPSKKAEPFKQWLAQVGAERIRQMQDPEQSIEQAVNLRDNMTNMELLLNALAEQTATDLSKERNPEGIVETAHVAKDGAEVARNARADIEHRLGHSVISDKKAIDYITPKEELPFEK